MAADRESGSRKWIIGLGLGLGVVAILVVVLISVAKRFLPQIASPLSQPSAGISAPPAEMPKEAPPTAALEPSPAVPEAAPVPAEESSEAGPREEGIFRRLKPGTSTTPIESSSGGDQWKSLWFPDESVREVVSDEYWKMSVNPNSTTYQSYVESLDTIAAQQVAKSTPVEAKDVVINDPWRGVKPVEKKEMAGYPGIKFIQKEREMEAVMWEYKTRGTIGNSIPREELARNATDFLARMKLTRMTLQDVYKQKVPRWQQAVIDDPLKPGDPRGPRGVDPSGFVPNPPHKD